MDITMPEMDGIAALKKSKKLMLMLKSSCVPRWVNKRWLSMRFKPARRTLSLSHSKLTALLKRSRKRSVNTRYEAYGIDSGLRDLLHCGWLTDEPVSLSGSAEIEKPELRSRGRLLDMGHRRAHVGHRLDRPCSLNGFPQRNRGWGTNRALRSLGGIPLGQNKSLQVVELSGRVYVVGVGDSITLLDKIDDPEASACSYGCNRAAKRAVHGIPRL